MAHDPLATLRDIHLPPPISWWPPAPGWFALIGLVLVLVLIVIFITYRWQRKIALRKQIMATFFQLKNDYDTNHNNAVFARLNQLLKQVALTYYPDERIANINGNAWLMFLNKTGKSEMFSDNIGQQLIEATYSDKPIDNSIALFASCEHWLRKQL